MNKSESIIDFKPDKKTIKKSILNSVIIQVLFKLKGIITMPIMTYFLLPREMGIFNLILVTASLLAPLFCMNLFDGPAIYLIQEKSKERIKDMYNVVINGSLLFFLLFTIIFWLVMHKFGGEYYNFLHLIVAIIFSMIIYKMFSFVLVAFQKTTTLVKYTFYKDTSSVILTILLVILGFSFYGMLIPIIITNIVAGLFIYRLIKRDLPYRIFLDKEILIKFLKMSLPLLPVFIFSWVVQSSDSYFLVYLKGEASVGKYSVIYGLSNVILILTYALNLFWNPISVKLWIEDREKYRKAFVSVFASLSTFLFIVVLLFELNSKLIVKILVSRPDYQDAYVIMGTIAFAFALQVLITLLTAPLYSNRNPGMIFFSYLCGGLINAFFNFILIPPFGLWGAAISTAVSYLVIVAIMSYLNLKVARFSFFDKRLVYLSGVFIVLWVGVAYLREHLQILQLLIGNVVLVLTLGTILYFKVLKEEEKQYIFSFFKEMKLRKASQA